MAHAVGLQVTVAVAVLHGLLEELGLLLLGDVAEGVALAVLQLTLEGGLNFLAEVFSHGLLGVTLHAAVDGGVNLQAILVHIVMLAVGLAVAAAPVLHVAAQVFAQVGSQTVVVALRRVVAHVERLGLIGFIVLVAQVVVAVHLVEHRIATCQRVVGVQYGTVGRGGLEQTHQHGSLVHVELRRCLVEESL